MIIIGGGINGAALARLAAFNGLATALFEAGDFGRGASTNTSKLLHGGLRYLETYDFGLVRDAVRERSALLALAPHLVEARRFLFPRTRLGRHGRFMIKAGMELYDLLAGRRRLDPHRWIPPRELRSMEPAFLPEEPCGAYAYSDCVMDDARLVIENLLDAASLGARVRNYCAFRGAEADGPGRVEVVLEDRLTGREIVHRAKHVALAAGPWTDQILAEAFPGSPSQVRLSQGIHLIAEGIPSQSCFILPVPGSKRYFFIVPWKGKHLIGTTETELGPVPPVPPAPRESEIAELLRLARTYFPDWKPDVICTITGIRPLARGRKGSTVTLSREHEFHTVAENVHSAVGGKYTTHRTFAAAFLRHILGREAPIRDIGNRPLPGAWTDPLERDAIRRGLMAFPFAEETVASAWLRRYGKRAADLADFVSGDAARRERLPGPYGFLAGELSWAAEKEWARTPEDFFRRRTDAYFTRGGGMECLESAEAFFLARTPGIASLGAESDYSAFLRANRHAAAHAGIGTEEG